MRRAVLLVAGGTGTRMGTTRPKQFLSLDHQPVIIHTLNCFLRFDPEIIVAIVIYPEAMGELQDILRQHLPEALVSRILLAKGGATRTVSVWNGLQSIQQALGGEDVWIGIQDAVRPFADEALLTRNYALAALKGNAVSCVSVKDSLRKKNPEGGSQAVNRAHYYAVQTPQTFRLSELYAWMENRPHDEYTDEASLAESFGAEIHLAEGSYRNLKITTPEDLVLARHFIQHPNFTV
jgi:2-C-methyl-D-erythritol 4-phosphate cytidylyltransferase